MARGGGGGRGSAQGAARPPPSCFCPACCPAHSTAPANPPSHPPAHLPTLMHAGSAWFATLSASPAPPSSPSWRASSSFCCQWWMTQPSCPPGAESASRPSCAPVAHAPRVRARRCCGEEGRGRVACRSGGPLASHAPRASPSLPLPWLSPPTDACFARAQWAPSMTTTIPAPSPAPTAPSSKSGCEGGREQGRGGAKGGGRLPWLS